MHPRVDSQTRSGWSCVKNKEDEENFAVASKWTKSSGELNSKSEKKKKDLSKIKCFSLHQFEHYATKCCNRKKGSKKDQVVASVEINEFFSHFEEFSLIACMASLVAVGLLRREALSNPVWKRE